MNEVVLLLAVRYSAAKVLNDAPLKLQIAGIVAGETGRAEMSGLRGNLKIHIRTLVDFVKMIRDTDKS